MDKWIDINYLKLTSGFATTHVVVSITYQSPHPLPTSQIRLKFILERIKLTARVASIHAHYTRYFPANVSTNPDVLQPKTFSIPRGIIPQNISSLRFAVSEEFGKIQTDRQTDSLTDWRFERGISQVKSNTWFVKVWYKQWSVCKIWI